MKKPTRLLIVDDHPMIIRGYQLTLDHIRYDFNIEFDTATNCNEVLDKMEVSDPSFYDLILLDIGLPSSESSKASNGEDLGYLIRREYPNTKIIVQTAINDMQCISNIFNTIKPEGFLIKSDIDEEILISCVSSILNNGTYYSEKVSSLLSPNDFDEIYIDNLNRKILFHISLGFKMKELPNYIPLSLPTIERRKKELKNLLGVPNGGNRELIEVARNKGFI